jgi:predicted SnoaL-like aldol condensation-catalyzing enzyme
MSTPRRHSANIPTGLQGFMDTFRPRFARKLPPDYKREILRIVAENDIVVIFNKQSRTSPEGKHEALLQFDMFRVENGKIVEHWDADT